MSSKFSFYLNTVNKDGFWEGVKNYSLHITVLIGVILHLLIAIMTNDTRYISQTGDSRTPSLDGFCTLFGEQLINKKLHPKIVTNDLFRKITANNYKVMEFSGNEKIFRTHGNDEHCGIVIRDDLGLRSFEVSYTKSESNPFYYSINGIIEESDKVDI